MWAAASGDTCSGEAPAWSSPSRPSPSGRWKKEQSIHNKSIIVRIKFADALLPVGPNVGAGSAVGGAEDVAQPRRPEWMRTHQSVHRCYMFEQMVASRHHEPSRDRKKMVYEFDHNLLLRGCLPLTYFSFNKDSL